MPIKPRLSKERRAEVHALVSGIWDKVMTPAIDGALKNLREAKKTAPRTLLHFTDAAGLVGILGKDPDTNRKPHLRLCPARSSNDPTELQYGLDMALKCLQGIKTSDEDLWKFKEEIDNSIKGAPFYGRRRDIPDPHICCLTHPRRERSIPQWALYGRNGSGCLIVFRGEELAKRETIDLVKVDYSAASQSKRMRDTLQRGLTAAIQGRWEARKLQILSESAIDRIYRSYANAFGSIVALQAAAMKRPEWNFEDEWRLSIGSVDEPAIGKQLKTGAFASGSIIKTYFELPIRWTDIDEIIVGPNVSALNIRAVRMILGMLGHGYRVIPVRQGDISLRGDRKSVV